MKKWTAIAWLLCILFLFSGCSLLEKLQGNQPVAHPAETAQTQTDEETKEPEKAPAQDKPQEKPQPQKKPTLDTKRRTV